MKRENGQIPPWKFGKESTGALSVAAFLISLLSGIFLAVPYDIARPFDSIALMMIANPFASFFRNLHYWSAQLFLILFLIHIVDYLRRKDIGIPKAGLWLRLLFSIALAVFVMLSGFILKGDEESLQASRILTTLFRTLPLVGDGLNALIMGRESSLQLLYVHHIATASLLLLAIIFEHIRKVWPSAKAFLYILLLSGFLSLLVNAPLHNGTNPILKGPWYFLGLQEILHWTARPGWTWILVLALFLMLYFLPGMRLRPAVWVKRGLALFAATYLLLSLVGFFFRGSAWAWVAPWEQGQWSLLQPYQNGRIYFVNKDSTSFEKLASGVQGKTEACLACHAGMEGFSPAHDPLALSCTSCHLGNPFTANKDAAHRKMVRIPGNLSDAPLTCGQASCHPDLVQRVDRSLMRSLRGMISVNRFVFGESDDLDALADVRQLGQSAADNHFRDLCSSCHLGNPKISYGPADMTQLGGGCNACHLNYNEAARKALDRWKFGGEKPEDFPGLHPQLSLDIGDDKCLGCHSRSGRIATNYTGWHETLLMAHQAAGVDSLRVMQDLRVFRFIEEDVHHRAGMRCVDCHISWELMGDGLLYAHKEEQTRVQCEDCHFSGEPEMLDATRADADVRRILEVKGRSGEDFRMLKTENGSYGLYHTGYADGQAWLMRKADQKKLIMKPPGKSCSQGSVHRDVSCTACHTAWVPTCIGCHNAYDPEAKGYDLYDNRFVEGAWEEYVGSYLADLPTLGVRKSGEGSRFVSCAPGMVLTIDKSAYTGIAGDAQYHRLFAPVSAHTIKKVGMGCRDCHNNPLVLGFGRGTLAFHPESLPPSWTFTPRFALRPEDGLPEDAWTGFMDGRQGGATRKDLRALRPGEQARMLRVGSCFHCHTESDAWVEKSLIDFETVLSRMQPACRMSRVEE